MGITLSKKLDKLDHLPHALGKDNLGALLKEIKKMKDKLNYLLNMKSKPFRALEVSNLENRLEKLLGQEETYWRQRSRNQWRKSGDRNTSFFYKTASERKKKNKIESLLISHNVLTSDTSQIEDSIITFYAELFKSQNPSTDEVDIITDTIFPLVSDVMNTKLGTLFTNKEIQKALFDLNPNKASGPDGYSALFFIERMEYSGKGCEEDRLRNTQ